MFQTMVYRILQFGILYVLYRLAYGVCDAVATARAKVQTEWMMGLLSPEQVAQMVTKLLEQKGYEPREYRAKRWPVEVLTEFGGVEVQQDGTVTVYNYRRGRNKLDKTGREQLSQEFATFVQKMGSIAFQAKIQSELGSQVKSAKMQEETLVMTARPFNILTRILVDA